jgi:zona occludens toxin (predicted ATPase)
MKLYAVQGITAAGQSNKTAATVIGSSAIRAAMVSAVFGLATNPNATDFYMTMAIAKFTAAGTAGSSPTPAIVDSGDPAAVCTAGITHSAEPTYASVDMLQVPMNQRSTFRWEAADGREIIAPATSANGVGAYLKASGLGSNITPNASIMFRE